MNTVQRLLAAALLAGCAAVVSAQPYAPTDTTIIFKPVRPDAFNQPSLTVLRNAWGLDLLLSNNGFGLGGFYRKEYTEDLAGTLSLAFSDAKDDNEVESYDYWTGQPYTPHKKNRVLMMPLMAGIQYRLFKDDIVENFRPFVTAGGGPTVLFVSPYAKVTTDGYEEQIDFFSSLKYGQAHYTAGIFLGAGAYFGIDKGTVTGITIRYYYIPVVNGIEIMRDRKRYEFGGFFITLNFGSFM